MITLKNICFSYPDKKSVLTDFSLEINDGQRVCIIGESGCGKSTVLKLICGILKPDSGFLRADGNPSCVFQEDRLLPWCSVAENLRLVKPDVDLSELKKLLSDLSIPDTFSLLPSQLSGGMKRRVAIARALLYDGDYLLLDEPFNGIDPQNKKIISKILLDKYHNKPILMVTHNKEDAFLLNADIVSFS